LDYPLFWLPFLPKVFAGSGAVFDAGATVFFFIFDVVITSFSMCYPFVVVIATYSGSLGTGINAFSLSRELTGRNVYF
jgi:hypothetical protein